jgi:DNA helicase IV
LTYTEIESEQLYVDHAYERLEAMHAYAQRLVTEAGARYWAPPGPERDALMRAGLYRREELALGDEPLVFGRVDRRDGERLYVGRTAVHDDGYEPLVIDWRAPAAEAFYRATPLEPMDVIRRRHLICRGRKVMRIDDELLDTEHAPDGLVLVGEGALLEAVRRSRTGRMRDIVATIQSEQDAIIRAPLEGALVVQGGPGTGKTAVALHRAAYLLYTHRRKLEREGVLLVGPNSIFLRYIDQVLPSLGETAVLATLTELVPGTVVTETEPMDLARVKGDRRMAKVIRRAVDRLPRELSEPARIVYEGKALELTVSESRRFVLFMREKVRGRHNLRRRRLARLVAEYLWEKWSKRERQWKNVLGAEGPRHFAETILADPVFRAALDVMWPSLSPQEFVASVLFSPQVLAEAAEGVLTPDEQALLVRPPQGLTEADVGLVDEAATLLGPQRQRRRRRAPSIDEEDRFMVERMLDDLQESAPMIRSMRGILADRYAAERAAVEDDGERTQQLSERFGHVIVDEAQGLSPMQWRMIVRRNPSKSMTILGDLGQASSAWVPESWEEALADVAQKVDLAELTINYRTPEEIMELAARVLAADAPALRPPRSVRAADDAPTLTRVSPDELVEATVRAARGETERLPDGKVAVIAAEAITGALAQALGIASSGRHTPAVLDERIAVINVDEARGLEFDSVVIAEPSAIVSDYGLRGLYVALTRSTQRLVVVHAAELPAALR